MYFTQKIHHQKFLIDVFSSISLIGVALVLFPIMNLSIDASALSVLGFIPLFRLGGCSDCGNSESGDSGDPGGDPGGPSTPFLCTWNGSKYAFENDFLFGEPETFFNNVSFGKTEYEAGRVGPDLYHIRNTIVPVDRKLRFQVREIEAEESFIDTLSFSHVTFATEGVLAVDHLHRKHYIFDRDELRTNPGVSHQVCKKGTLINASLSSLTGVLENNDTGCYLNQGEQIEVSAKISNPNQQIYFLLSSYYREWKTTSDRFAQEKNGFVASTISFMQRTSATRFVTVIVLAGVLSISSVFGKVFASDRPVEGIENSPFTFSSLLGIQTAQADDTKSLFIELWDWKTEQYKHELTVHPRFNQKSLDAVVIPRSSLSEGGRVKLRITATRKHYVNTAAMFATDRQLSSHITNLTVTKIHHNRQQKDFTPVLEAQFSGEYLRTVPGDIVEIEVEAPAKTNKNKNEQEALLLKASGFYSGLSTEGKRISGDWIKSMDVDSRAVLERLAGSKSITVGDVAST